MQSQANYSLKCLARNIEKGAAALVFAASEDPAEGVEGAVFVASAAGGGEFAAEFLEGHALQDEAAGAGEGGEKEALSSKKGGFDAACVLDVVVDGLIESDDAAGLDLQAFAGLEGEFDEVAASVDEDEAGASEFLENEAFSSEEARSEFLDERDAELDGRLGEEEGIALGKDGLAGGEFEGLDATRPGASEADFAGAFGAEVSDEERFSGDRTADGSEDFFTKGFAGHTGFPGDVLGFVDHFAGFGIKLLARSQADAGDLEILDDDGVLEGVRRVAGGVGGGGTGRGVRGRG